MSHHPKPEPASAAGEIVRVDAGGWISGPSSPPMPETAAALMRAFGSLWTITYREVDQVWLAEKRDGTAVYVLAAHHAWELAAKIEAAEATP